MSLKACIRNLRAAGEITLEHAQALEKRYDALAREVLPPATIRQRIIAELEAEKAEKKRIALLTETRRSELDYQLDQYRDRSGRENLGEALVRLLEHHGEARFDDVEHKRLAILGQAHAEMEEVLHEFRKGAFAGDLRRRQPDVAARMDNVVRELFGEATGDPKAKGLAEAWEKVAEDLRQRFNAAGGATQKLEKWGLPQHHDQQALLNAGFHKWRDTIAPLLAPEKMRHPLTGDPMTRADLDPALNVIFDRISTEGWIDRDPSGAAVGKGALFRQRQDHRFLVFRTADAWLEYQKAFGEADPYSAMMGHISTLSRDIAAMEVLGPNPAAMIEYLKQRALKQAAMGAQSSTFDPALGQRVEMASNTPTADEARRAVHRAEDMWRHMAGSVNVPVGSRMANVVSGMRNLISAASLGAAQISALSDPAFQILSRRFNGLPVLPMVSEYIRQFGTAGTREAARAGLILDSAVHAMHSQARYMGSISGREITGYINDRVLTFQGLQAWTQAGKHAFGLAIQAELADHAGRALADVPPPLRRMLERHGISSDDWGAIGKAKLYEPEGGSHFLRPNEIAAAAGRQIADRYLAMILRETRYAVPEATVRARSAMISANQPGTLVGELVRSAGQFKSFGVAVIMLHGGRIAAELAGGQATRGAAYAGALLITSMLFGGVSQQLKQIKDGRDPMTMRPLEKEGAKFWGAALLQGGGLGIYGDFLFSDVNRFGGSLAGTVAGPIVSRLDDVRRLTIGNALEFGQGKEKTNFGRELVQFVRTNTPGSSLWYARLAWDRLLMDQLQQQLDPAAHQAFRRRVDSRRKEFGQDHWWHPGETAPRRGPDLGGGR